MTFQPHPALEAERRTLGSSVQASDVADAARRYQLTREIEAKHLAVMAQHNLQVDWTPEVRAIVVAAREHIQSARAARADFRGHLRAFVTDLRSERQSLPAVLRQTRTLVQVLQAAGAITDDGGWLEAEILEWAIEEFDEEAA